MLIKEWSILLGLLLLYLSHNLTMHTKAMIGTVSLIIIACWLIRKGISKWRRPNDS